MKTFKEQLEENSKVFNETLKQLDEMITRFCNLSVLVLENYNLQLNEIDRRLEVITEAL